MARHRFLGKGQIAICMRSGIKCKASELVRDGRNPALLVLPEWADPAHPQERPYVPEDEEGTPSFQPSPENPPVTPPVLTAVPEFGPQVHLTWTAAVRAAGPRIEEYDVYRDAGTGFVLLTTVAVVYDMFGGVITPGLSYVDHAVVAEALYSYKVVGLTSSGQGLTSNTVTVAAVVPTSPVLSGTFNSPEIDLSWTAATSGSYPITSYRLYRSVDGGAYALLATTLPAVRTYNDTSTNRFAHRYTYKVVATNEFSGVSPDSNIVDFVKILAMFVAARLSSSVTGVMTSTNGIDWTARTTPASVNTAGMAFSPQLGRIVTVGSNSAMTSDDGINWTQRTPASGTQWSDVCWSAEKNLFLACSQEGISTSAVMTSPDGITWTIRTVAGPVRSWRACRWLASAGLFVIGGSESGFGLRNGLATSPDGITWTTRTAALDQTGSVGYIVYRMTTVVPTAGAPYFACSSRSDFGAMTSPDGINWTWKSDATAAFGGTGNVAYGQGKLMLSRPDGSHSLKNVYSLNDGTTWNLTPVANQGGEGFVYSPELAMFVMTDAGVVGHQSMYSANGITWSAGNTPSSGDWNNVCSAVFPA